MHAFVAGGSQEDATMHRARFLVVMLLVPVCCWSQYEPVQGWYAGGGWASTNVFANEDSGVYGNSERGNSDSGFIVNGGYRFNRFVAIEAGYLAGGEPTFDTFTLSPAGTITPVYVQVAQETDAFELSGNLILPFFKIWEVYIKLGAAFWDASSDQIITPSNGDPVIQRNVDKDGIDFLLGVGFGVTAWKNLHVRFEVQAFRTNDALLAIENDPRDREARFDAYLLEAHWRFGDKW